MKQILIAFFLFIGLLYCSLSFAQTKTIKGHVRDSFDQSPVIGASIIVENSKIGSKTDKEGNFQLTVPKEEGKLLKISAIGYAQTHAEIKNEMTIELSRDDANLNEVVVVGYGTQKKVNLTGAVSQVDGKVLTDRPISNITQGLQGAIPNVNINFQSGRPGSKGSVNIRGYASINSSNAAPLVLIDGVPGDLNTINPRDVESISALKDASVAAIYGARAAFGVILITTKSAKDGKMSISYSNNFGWSGATVSTDFITDGYDAAILNDEAFKRATGNTYTGYTDEDYAELYKRKTDRSLPSVIIDNRKGKDQYVYYGNTDWWNTMFHQWQTSMEHSLNFTGGTEKVNFFLSGRVFEKNGLMKINRDRFQMYNMRGKFTAKVTNWLTITNNTQFNYNSYIYPGWQKGEEGRQIFSSITVHALPSYVPTNPDGTATFRTELNNYTIGDGVYADLLHGKSKGGQADREFINNFNAVFKLSDQIHLTGNYAYTFNPENTFNRQAVSPWSIRPGEIQYLGTDLYTNSISNRNYHVLNIFGDYNKDFSGKHHFKALLGYNQELESLSSQSGTVYDLVSEDLNSFDLGSGDMLVSGSSWTSALQGVFGRINYDFDGRYLFELNARYDGTSRFPKGQNFGLFPSLSAGWRVSEENFFKPLKKGISDLKFRFSFGTLGNQQQAAVYGYIPLLSRGNLGIIQDGKRVQFLSVPNPISESLTWERTRSLNFGADFGVLNNRLTGSFDWYIRKTLDMLIPGKTLPAVFGASASRQNAGDLKNTGWELSLKWLETQKLLGKDFSYNFGIVLSDYKATITRFDNPTDQLSNYYIGQQLGEIWGYRVAGLFASDEEAANWKINQDFVDKQRLSAPGEWSNLKGGDLKFRDLNGDGIVDNGKNTLDNPGDMEIIGNSLPRYSFGITTGFNWNGFDLNAFFQGIGRQNWYPGNNSDKFWGPYSRPYYSFLPKDFANDVWTPENPNAYYPLLRGYIALNANGSLNVKNDRYLQDLAYIRLKNLTLGYNLPNQVTSKLKLSKARLYVSGENIWTATKLRSKYIDPEQAATDTNGRTYPFATTYSFGLDVTF